MTTGNRNEMHEKEDMLRSVLRGQKVYIKGVEQSDLAKRVEWINDPVIQRTLNFKYPMSLSKMEKWLGAVVGDMSRRDFSVFTISDGSYIGFGGFLNIDISARKAELYATIGDHDYWGGGYGFDLYSVLMCFGFQELGLNRIYGYQLTFNKAAKRVVEKLGWRKEGLLRQDLFAHGELRDRTVVAILKDDWLRTQV